MEYKLNLTLSPIDKRDYIFKSINVTGKKKP